MNETSLNPSITQQLDGPLLFTLIGEKTSPHSGVGQRTWYCHACPYLVCIMYLCLYMYMECFIHST